MTVNEAKEILKRLNIPEWEVKEVYKGGGQGITIKVYNITTKDYGVFKMPKNAEARDLKRFDREIEVLKEVATTNSGIVPILAHSVPGDTPWYISKLGLPFKDYWIKFRQEQQENAIVVFEKALEITAHILDGLTALHNRRDPIIHRDIKPDNIVIIDGKPHLIDFGVAYWSEKERLTDVNDAVGNKRYSPDPMMYRMEEITPWLDVFMVSQLFMWMIADKPTKNWDRPNDFRFVRYSADLDGLISKIYAFTGACSEESVAPKHAGEMSALMKKIFYKAPAIDESDLKKVIAVSQRIEEKEATLLAHQLNEKVEISRKVEAMSGLVSLKVQEINEKVDAFLARLRGSGVNAVVERRKDDAVTRLLQTISSKQASRGVWAEEMISIKISQGGRELHFGLIIKINLDHATSMDNPFYIGFVRLLKYEKDLFMDEKCDIYFIDGHSKKQEVDVVEFMLRWLEDESNWG
ncbi:hypothetical protein A4D02_33620 [Niastella koreensis]|uniref:Serine/threonine protein kinase n=2 Tax=Niastella koreensis TaxID=354356 RepID=G8TAG9_NIAKG|nr:protein kinase [Niastella koreensis]AEV98131.1 serine/threonine protein kinase [Niastella koreensis GR20-10]OQP45339.1 hypothetical protein A4D02_33620 [Niastella koreensis]